jgi:Phage integrase, N-terminal SAM-like domain
MTRLRRRMSEDMQVRGLSPSTQRVYLERVTQFADYFGRSPEILGCARNDADSRRSRTRRGSESARLSHYKPSITMLNPRISRTPALSQPTLRGTRTSVIGNDCHELKSSDGAQRANQIIRPESSG